MPINQNTHDQLERRLQDIDWDALRRPGYTPSPAAWEDQVLYFLMLDRFSDGREKGFRDNSGNLDSSGSTPPFRFPDDAYTADRAAWADAGDAHALQSALDALRASLAPIVTPQTRNAVKAHG